MIITYFGRQFFKIQQGDMVVAFNPISKESKSSTGTYFGADMALITINHPDYNGVAQLSHGERAPFVVDGPGDYEVKQIFIKGVLSKSLIDGQEYINTIYALTIDNLKIAFLGVLSDEEISKEAREAISNPDVLFISVGGKESKGKTNLIDVKNSAKLVSALEPKLVIPMDYDDKSLKTFLKETGEEKAEVMEKLTLKQKDLDGKSGEVVVLKSA